MVVQKENYQEMPAFIELGESLVHNNRNSFVEFKRLRQYYGVSDQDYKRISLDSADALMTEDFLNILNRVEAKRKYNAKNSIRPDINHNLQEYIIPEKENISSLTRLTTMLSSKDIFSFLKSR